MKELLPFIESDFDQTAASAVRVVSFMDGDYRQRLEAMVRAAKVRIDAKIGQNPSACDQRRIVGRFA